MQPAISVVVPTYNRAESLKRTLGALLRQTLEADLYEIVVVDNNSTDATRDTVDRIAAGDRRACGSSSKPVVRYVFEGGQGVAHARNAGLAAARGEFVAYTDDDGIASSRWLECILKAFREVVPAPVAVGGPVFPVFVGRRPSWYRDKFHTHCWGDTARFLGRREVFFGMNVAFRRESVLAVGGFDTSLGMVGDTLGMGEDAEVFRRLSTDRGSDVLAYYDPRAIVHHFIPDSRTVPLYAVKRSFVVGRARYRIERLRKRNAVAGFVRHGVRLALCLGRACLVTVLLPHPGRWLTEQVAPVAREIGYFAAAAGVIPRIKRAE